ncbi:hypothetical protein [Enterocloster citroniae]
MDIKELEEKIIKECKESGLGYGDVIRAIKDSKWYFISRGETFLKTAGIKEVSSVKPDYHIQVIADLMDEHTDKNSVIL